MSEQETEVYPQEQIASPAWERIERARHPQRPYPMDLIERIFTDFSEIHGDRAYGDDEAVACGMARLGADEVMVIGNRKGGSTKERVRRNFGMPHPEGYRKALRAMKIAEKFARPVISFIDLPGAYPGLGAEERGQAEAIARNIREMSRLRVPTISVISGEGGSGGALALAVSDRVLILENALYFVITPEGCAVHHVERRGQEGIWLPKPCASPRPRLRRWAAWTRSSPSRQTASMPAARPAQACWAPY